MRRLVLALAVYALSGAAAFADSDLQVGPGTVERYEHDILDAARAPPIDELGDDAVRFSSQPALGGGGYIIVLRADGRARVDWFYGHGRSGWRKTRTIAFRVHENEYRHLVTQIDRLLDEAAPELRAMDEQNLIALCSDGPDYLTERVRAGEAYWYRPDCSGVNEEIAALLTSWTFARLGE